MDTYKNGAQYMKDMNVSDDHPDCFGIDFALRILFVIFIRLELRGDGSLTIKW